MATAEARDVTPGDEIRLSGRTVATIEDVAAYTTENSTEQTVFVEAELDTPTRSDRRFGGTLIRRGQTVTLPAGDYTLRSHRKVNSGFLPTLRRAPRDDRRCRNGWPYRCRRHHDLGART